MSRPPSPRLLVLFPGALGDLLCCWPALVARRARDGAALILVARPAWFDALPVEELTAVSIERREIADLFADAPLADATRHLFGGMSSVESWTGYGDANVSRRLAAATGAPVAVHPFRALRPGEHAAQYYARCLAVEPATLTVPLHPAATAWAAQFWTRHGLGERALAIHCGSGSPRKNWEGAATVAAAWRAAGGTVVIVRGPAERGSPTIEYDAVLDGEPLDRVAAVLARAWRYLGNDSGISHLAGLVGARGVAVFGPSDPSAWRPLGHGIRVLHAPEPCPRCGRDRLCAHRVSLADVLAALEVDSVGGSRPA